jgi:hypothetical protein
MKNILPLYLEGDHAPTQLTWYIVLLLSIQSHRTAHIVSKQNPGRT